MGRVLESWDELGGVGGGKWLDKKWKDAGYIDVWLHRSLPAERDIHDFKQYLKKDGTTKIGWLPFTCWESQAFHIARRGRDEPIDPEICPVDLMLEHLRGRRDIERDAVIFEFDGGRTHLRYTKLDVLGEGDGDGEAYKYNLQPKSEYILAVIPAANPDAVYLTNEKFTLGKDLKLSIAADKKEEGDKGDPMRQPICYRFKFSGNRYSVERNTRHPLTDEVWDLWEGPGPSLDSALGKKDPHQLLKAFKDSAVVDMPWERFFERAIEQWDRRGEDRERRRDDDASRRSSREDEPEDDRGARRTRQVARRRDDEAPRRERAREDDVPRRSGREDDRGRERDERPNHRDDADGQRREGERRPSREEESPRRSRRDEDERQERSDRDAPRSSARARDERDEPRRPRDDDRGDRGSSRDEEPSRRVRGSVSRDDRGDEAPRSRGRVPSQPCPMCSADWPDDANRCPECGAKADADGRLPSKREGSNGREDRGRGEERSSKEERGRGEEREQRDARSSREERGRGEEREQRAQRGSRDEERPAREERGREERGREREDRRDDPPPREDRRPRREPTADPPF